MKLKLWVHFGYTPSSSQIKVFITGGLLADITSYFAFQDFFRISLPPYLKKDVTCLYIQGKKTAYYNLPWFRIYFVLLEINSTG